MELICMALLLQNMDTLWEKNGNDHADRYAKLVAKMNPWRDDAIDIHTLAGGM